MQLTIEAYDSATPDIRGSAKVVVTVRRNENKPVFGDSSYSASINTSMPQGVPFVQVTAQDEDGVRIDATLHNLVVSANAARGNTEDFFTIMIYI